MSALIKARCYEALIEKLDSEILSCQNVTEEDAITFRYLVEFIVDEGLALKLSNECRKTNVSRDINEMPQYLKEMGAI